MGFSKIDASLTSMLKTTMSLPVLAANKLLGTRVLAANDVGNVDCGGDGSSDRSKRVEPKTRRSEGQKTSKSQKSAKFRKLSKSGNLKGKKLARSKKPSKNRNSPNFDTKKAGPSFLTPKARSAFNCLWLSFTKTPILQHFDPKYHIWIKTDASGYAIDGVLS